MRGSNTDFGPAPVSGLISARVSLVPRDSAYQYSALRKPVEKEYLPPRTGDVRDSWADVAEARRLLGWEPQVGLEEGLRLTADAFLARA